MSFLLLLCSFSTVFAQEQVDNRILFNGRTVWLNGGNVAWVRFAGDIGPGKTDLDLFEQAFSDLERNGGNTLRLWLHTNGSNTPEWNGSTVVGPGEGAIEDLRSILDLAHKHRIGLMLCLWSFDMLRISTGPAVTDRNYALLMEEDRLQSYIDAALVPTVAALKGHPAILAWEIFNEPEGMSEEFGWDFNRHVPMVAIQRFINRTTGAIKRVDPRVAVTNGSWSFRAASDVTSGIDLLIEGKSAAQLTAAETEAVRGRMADRYGYDFSQEQSMAVYDTLRSWKPNFNYYTDQRLVAAGGDPQGVLDYYTVHYYSWASTLLSPFHHDKSFWQLDKPLVIAEFFLDDTFGVNWIDLYQVLYDRGYAGALGWQWFDHHFNRNESSHNWPRLLEAAKQMSEMNPVETRLFSE